MVPISPENTELREFFVYKSHPAYYYVLVILGAASDATLDNDAPGFCSWGRSYLVVISIFETTTLYDKTVPAINMHIRNILSDEELAKKSTIKEYLIVQSDGTRAMPIITKKHR